MGQKSSKQKQPPWGSVPAGYYPPGGYGPNPPFIPPGFQPPPGMQYPPFAMPGQQGFIPPGVYGQAGMAMPPPQLAWMQNDKEAKKDRKGKRRAQSEQFPGGFVPGPNGPGFPQRASSLLMVQTDPQLTCFLQQMYLRLITTDLSYRNGDHQKRSRADDELLPLPLPPLQTPARDTLHLSPRREVRVSP